jgi:hypothetical protein
MTEKQRKGIDFVINNLKKKYPAIERWVRSEHRVFSLYITIELNQPIKEGDFYEMGDIANTYYKLLPDEYCFMVNVYGGDDVHSTIRLTISGITIP